MPRRTTSRDDDPPDDWDDDFGADEGAGYDPEADWSPGDEFLPGDPAEVPCPHCGATITEDHQRCPACDMFISKEDVAQEEGGGRGVLWAVLMGLCLLMAVLWAAGF